MYYLTRIELDPYKKLTQLALKNANMIHGTIEKVFGNEAERKLWRIDSLRGRRYLMIVSQTLPDFTQLLMQFVPDGAKSQSKSYDDFLESIEDGSRWNFKLCGVPLVCRKTEYNPNGKRFPLLKPEEQMEWLIKKGNLHGFTVNPEHVRITDTGPAKLSKGAGENHYEFKIRKVIFDGILTVTDPEKFRDAMVNGIGKERAFGGGMITVVPSKE